MAPKMKFSFVLQPPAADPPNQVADPVVQASAVPQSTNEPCISLKRDRDDDMANEVQDSFSSSHSANINPKRVKQDCSLPVALVKAEPDSPDGMNCLSIPETKFLGAIPKYEQPWYPEAIDLLDFMDSQDKYGFFRAEPGSPSNAASVSFARAQLESGAYDSFDDFAASLSCIYKSAERHFGTDVHKQSIKLLEILENKIQGRMHESVSCSKQELSSKELSEASEKFDVKDGESKSDDDAVLVDEIDFREREEMRLEDVKFQKSCISDDESDYEQLPQSSLRASFVDKYENHPDHAERPFWVCLMVRKEYDGQENKRGETETHVFFEFYRIHSKEKAREAENFILSIAEPVNRPSFIHEYKLTVTSLYAAVTIGKSTDDIINELTRQAKNVLPQETVNFIEKHTRNIGKLELVDSGSDNLSLIVYDDLIAQKISGFGDLGSKLFELGLRKEASDAPDDAVSTGEAWKREFDEDGIMRSSLGTTSRFILTSPQHCTQICKVLLDVINLYDFKNDTSVKKVDMRPRSEASLRPYQDECLSKIFSNGRARSGIIVLPCGAGKTLVGVSVASLIQRDTVVLCSGAVAVRQWAEQFQMWTTVDKSCIIEFTANIGLDEARMRSGVIVITTYSMFRRGIKTGRQEANPGAKKIVGHNWGLLILDEVHMAPANVTEDVMRHMTKVKCKVGLTATLVREDAKVQSLDILVGPKLYEAKWMALAENGYIARVRCLEVMCPMTSEFSRRYLEATDFRAKMRLWTLNPNKYLACLYILNLHKERQDKVLIFIDDLVTLHSYEEQLNQQGFSVKAMHGQTQERDRNDMIKSYKGTQGFAVLLLSSVGDVAIDLPEASVLIEVAAHFGSRRQEAQRLGRILRAKANLEGMFNASFYVLVSKDTGEMYFAPKRQAYLVAQGYAYTAVCMRGPGEEEMWGQDTGIEINFIQKLENYHNEKKDYTEKNQKEKAEQKMKREVNRRDGKSHRMLNSMFNK